MEREATKAQKRWKLSLCFLLSVLFLSAACVQASAEETDLQEAVELIDTISDAGQYFPEDTEQPMTRSQFICAAEALFGGYADPAPVSFTDVSSDDALYETLQKAVSLGWISDDTAFRPDDTITLYEAVKICCSIAGYDVRAMLAGGYPTGYIITAERAGILDASLNSVQEMSGRNALQLIWNTLHTDMMEAVSYGSEYNAYAATKGETVLAVYFGVYIDEGVVNANAYTMFGTADAQIEEGRAEIDGEAYTVSDDKAHDYLGYHVRGYYRRNAETGKNELVYVFPAKNRVLTLRANEAAYYASDQTITYGDEKTLSARLNPGYEYVYNGRVEIVDSEALLPEAGEVTLIDNNNDGKYEVVSVQECYYMEVGAVNKYYYTITDKWDENKLLDFSSDLCRYQLMDSEGKEIPLIEIDEGNILAVYASRDDLLIHAQILEESIVGVLQERYTDEKLLVVDATEYESSPEFAEQYFDTLTLGAEYEFTLGVYGEIVKASSLEGQWYYAYLKNAALTGTFRSTLLLQLFTQYGEHVVVEGADKIRVNDIRMESNEAMTALSSGGAVEPQLIHLKTDAEGKVSALATATVTTAFNPQEEQSEEKLKQYDFGADSYYYYSSQLYPYFNISGSIIFKIPADVNNEKGYAIGASFSNGNIAASELIPYDISATGTAGAVVYYNDSMIPAQSSTTSAILVEDVVTAVDAEGNTCVKIHGWSDGKFVEYYLDEEVEILKYNAPAELGSGDIIHAACQGDTIMSLVVDFIGSTLSPNSGPDVGVFNSTARVFQYQAGQVYSAQDGYLYLSDTQLGGSYDFSLSNLINIKMPSAFVLYDMETGTIRPADASYLNTYLSAGSQASYLVVQQSYFNGRYGFIYQ